MRNVMMVSVALLVSLALTNNAEASKKKKTPVDEPVTTEQPADAAAPVAVEEALEIKTTGIADVDHVFEAAVAPLNTLRDARHAIDDLNNNLVTSLGLTAGTPFADALTDLKAKAEGKLALAIDERGMPKLSASDAVPENVQTALDAVNNGIKNAMDAAEKLTELPNQMKDVIVAGQAINAASLSSSGVKVTEAPKILKSVMGNIKTCGKAPEELKAFTDSLMDMKNTLQSTFGA